MEPNAIGYGLVAIVLLGIGIYLNTLVVDNRQVNRVVKVISGVLVSVMFSFFTAALVCLIIDPNAYWLVDPRLWSLTGAIAASMLIIAGIRAKTRKPST